MNICAVRAFAAGGHDAYSSWFWRYPPLLNLILALGHPLDAGFPQRAELISLAVSAGSLIALIGLNRQAWGRAVAIGSALAFAVMPGAIFHGLWIKQDNLGALCGLAALALACRERWIWAGLVMGAALLAKQTTVFYAVALGWPLLLQKRFKPLASVAIVAGLAACWWYLFFSTSDRLFLRFLFTGHDTAAEQWNHPWHYYGEVLLRDLGPLGVLLAIAGVLFVARFRDFRVWPLALTVSGLAVLSASPGKTPWYAAMLYPGIATLQAVGAIGIWGWIRQYAPAAAVRGRWVPAAVAVFALGIFALPVFEKSYEEFMRDREPGMWDAAFSSREAAVALNELAGDADRALITPMHYYGEEVKVPCPIFTVYLKPLAVRVEPNDLDAGALVDSVRAFNLSWAMVSPPPGSSQKLLRPLVNEYHLRPRILRNAVIFDTKPLLREESVSHGN